MVGRALILTVIGTFIISMMITRTISRSSNAQSDNVVRLFTRVTGRNLAQSGVNLALRTLASHPSRRTPASWTLSDGKVSVSLLDVHYRGRAAVQIVSTARVPNQSSMDAVFSRDTTFTTIAYLPKGFIPKWVKGVITTNNPVKIGGNVDVDGRDHDTTGAAIKIGRAHV